MKLLELADEIASTILVSWLAIIDVAHLDSALCNRKLRKDFIRSAYTLAPLESDNFIKWFPSRLREFSAWVLLRNALTCSVEVCSMLSADPDQTMQYIRTNGKFIRSISCIDPLTKGSAKVTLHFIIPHCPNVTALDASHLHPGELLPALPFMPQLCRLNLGYQLHPEEISAISKHCKVLKELVYQKHTTALRLLHTAQFVALTENCGQIECFSYNYEVRIPAEVTIALATNCSNLTTLFISGKGLTDSGLTALADHCRKLRRLRLRNVCKTPGFSTQSLEILAAACDLTELALECMPHISDQLVQSVTAKCRHLSVFSVCGSVGITDTGIRHVARNCAENLQDLDISKCPALTDISLVALGRICPQLCALDVTHCVNVSAEGIGSIVRNCGKLTALSCASCRCVTDNVLLQIGQHCRALRELDLSGCPLITDVGVSAMAEQCSQLVSIDLHNCRRISSAGRVLATLKLGRAKVKVS
jgi:F-box/leucine-rich repeat protein 2/20